MTTTQTQINHEPTKFLNDLTVPHPIADWADFTGGKMTPEQFKATSDVDAILKQVDEDRAMIPLVEALGMVDVPANEPGILVLSDQIVSYATMDSADSNTFWIVAPDGQYRKFTLEQVTKARVEKALSELRSA